MAYKSIKKTLLSALRSAIDWENSLLEANCYCQDKRGENRCRALIKRYENLLNRIDANRPLTLNQYLDEGLKSGSIKLLTLDDLRKLPPNKTFGKDAHHGQ